MALSLDASPFKKGLGRATKMLKNWRSQIIAAGAVISTALAAGGMSALVKSSAAAIDRISKLGRTFGVSARERAAFELLAGRSGVQLEIFARGARNISKIRYDALIRQNKDAIRTFELLGISMSDLQRLDDPTNLLQRTAIELSHIEDGADKSALAMKLLGGRAAEMVNAFAGAGRAIFEARMEAERFGLALTDKANNQIETLNDTVGDFGQLWTGFWRQFTGVMGKGMLDAARALRGFVTGFVDDMGGMSILAAKAAQGVVSAVQWMARQIARIADSLHVPGTIIGTFVDTLTLNIEGLQKRFRDRNKKIREDGFGSIFDAGNVKAVDNFFDAFKRGIDKAARAEQKASNLRRLALFAGDVPGAGGSGGGESRLSQRSAFFEERDAAAKAAEKRRKELAKRRKSQLSRSIGGGTFNVTGALGDKDEGFLSKPMGSRFIQPKSGVAPMLRDFADQVRNIRERVKELTLEGRFDDVSAVKKEGAAALTAQLESIERERAKQQMNMQLAQLTPLDAMVLLLRDILEVNTEIRDTGLGMGLS